MAVDHASSGLGPKLWSYIPSLLTFPLFFTSHPNPSEHHTFKIHPTFDHLSPVSLLLIWSKPALMPGFTAIKGILTSFSIFTLLFFAVCSHNTTRVIILKCKSDYVIFLLEPCNGFSISLQVKTLIF